MERKIKDLERRLKEKEDNRDDLRREYERLKERHVDDCKGKLDERDVEEKVKRKERELEDVLKRKDEHLKIEMEKFKAKVETISHEVEKLQGIIRLKESENNNNQEKIRRLTKMVEGFKKQKKNDVEKVKKELSQQHDQLKSQHDDLKKKHNTLKHKSKKNYDAYHHMKKKHDDKHKKLEKEKREKIESVQELKQQIDKVNR